MAKKDRNYYLDRVRAEREMALLTRDPAARRAHISLAEAYIMRVLAMDAQGRLASGPASPENR